MAISCFRTLRPFPINCSNFVLQVFFFTPTLDLSHFLTLFSFLGPSLSPCWIRIGVPLHSWSEKVFQIIGEFLGRVGKVADDVKLKRRVDVARVRVLIDSKTQIPRSIDLEVGI